MAEDRRKNSLAVQTIQRVGVGVADAGRLDLDQHFTGFRTFQIEFNDFERLLGLKGDCGARFHFMLLLGF